MLLKYTCVYLRWHIGQTSTKFFVNFLSSIWHVPRKIFTYYQGKSNFWSSAADFKPVNCEFSLPNLRCPFYETTVKPNSITSFTYLMVYFHVSPIHPVSHWLYIMSLKCQLDQVAHSLCSHKQWRAHCFHHLFDHDYCGDLLKNTKTFGAFCSTHTCYWLGSTKLHI